MDEPRADGDDDDEGGNSEDDHGEYEDAAGSAGDGTDVDSVEAELNAYTRMQQVPLDTDRLMWWKQHSLDPSWSVSTWLFLPLLHLLRDSSAVWGS